MNKPYAATVFIPTYNGERYLHEILTKVFTQKIELAYEVLIIDSGSKDKTLEIIRLFSDKHTNLRLVQILNTEYGHGKTRNQAAHLAHGEIVVYLSHDATPAHDLWLYEMIRPFEINDKIVGVMGKQIPRAHCIPMLKSEIRGVFAGFGPDFGTTLFYKDSFVQDQGTYDAIGFYSDANSAARKSYLVGKFPYRDVAYAEDQLLGRDIINAGYYKAYTPRGSVVHSNDLRLNEYRYRMFDETLALRTIGLPFGVPSKKTILRLLVRGIARDTAHIVRDREFTFKRKCYWLLVNPLFHIEKWRGVRLGATVPLDDSAAANKFSLEKRNAQTSTKRDDR